MQWIRCKKTLPEANRIVLITDGYKVGLGFRGLWGNKKEPMTFYRPVSLDPIYGIVAWKPVPKPFKNKSRKKLKFNTEEFCKPYSLKAHYHVY